ncbi:hypothetical protein CC1G_10475 [Coprinopsis cinerea okayama7|uniref:Heme haloperoxidase family profile domain-containing protein n=1 Tax=Coprinopsis cinerea (strain Okayama-7 / 130 / ATCC MYA-4618 / FGSC 9003) TaxID=240176 RepID=A8NL34_COPC7|nr:hypothetical protein CC1G_10475 [Coprinopsis cinerea okayama7\|eukprot:XP_001834601.2 hypothetical protein CC1G_10475 [Coprinopsis cinerea okayama7\
MHLPLPLLTLAIALANVNAFPAYQSLGGLSKRQLETIIPGLPVVNPGPPPGPLADSTLKLVNDAAHPYQAPRPHLDHRGPCPGLNTLANHGYLPRSGIATPAQIVQAVMEGGPLSFTSPRFNMENTFAKFVTYAAFLVDGNPITNLMSIGGKTWRTGIIEPPPPAIVGGLNTHAVFEGDTSMTRGDFHFGDNHSFNQTLFDQFVEYSNIHGGGFYNLTAATELRYQRIQQSIATNPEMSFVSPRWFTAILLQDEKFPDDFHRAPGPFSFEGLGYLVTRRPMPPGRNVGGVDNYVPDPNSADFNSFCKMYEDFVNDIVVALYPNPTGLLRRNLIKNLEYFWTGMFDPACTEVKPYGTL